MKNRARILPFMLVAYFVLALAAVNVLANLDPKIFVSLLAPVLWLGLYLLGSDHSTERH